MINWEEFNSFYQPLGNELIIEIIDMFLDGDKYQSPLSPSYDEMIIEFKRNVDEKDFQKILLDAHYMRQIFSNFYDRESSQIARNMREMARSEIDTGLTEEFEKVKIAADILVIELREYRKTLTA
jgi:hypothetical protein